MLQLLTRLIDINYLIDLFLRVAVPEDEGEMFQVRKSYHSKRVMRMLDKERRRKKKEEKRYPAKNLDSNHRSSPSSSSSSATATKTTDFSGGIGSVQRIDGERTPLSNSNSLGASSSEQHNVIKSDNIQTEIRTDDFVVRLLLSCYYQKFYSH